MPDPITVDHYRAQVVFHGNSGLPRDVFVNSFVGRNSGELTATRQNVHDNIKKALASFYGEAVSTARTVCSFLAGLAWSGVTLRTYDLGQTPPRDPIVSSFDTATWQKDTASLPLPYEVAACVTWHSTVKRPWGRGRTYLGPLIASANTGTGISGPIPSDLFINTVKEAAARYLTGLDWKPVVLGKLGPQQIVGGYVDNAWDSQRRRGTDPTARSAFGTSP